MLRHVTHWSSLHILSQFSALRCASPTTLLLTRPLAQEATKREPTQRRISSQIPFDDVLDEGEQPFVPETEQPEKTVERVRVCRPFSLIAAS